MTYFWYNITLGLIFRIILVENVLNIRLFFYINFMKCRGFETLLNLFQLRLVVVVCKSRNRNAIKSRIQWDFKALMEAARHFDSLLWLALIAAEFVPRLLFSSDAGGSQCDHVELHPYIFFNTYSKDETWETLQTYN